MAISPARPHDAARPVTLSRRSLVSAAAWSAPAITLATAAPAYAVSGDPTITVGSVSPVAGPFTLGTTWYHWAGGTFAYSLRLGDPTTAGPTSVLTTTISGITTSAGTGTGRVTAVVVIPGNVNGNNRASAQYTSTLSAGWTLVGAPAIDGATRATSWTCLSDVVTPGSTHPDLVLQVTNSNNTGSTTFNYTAATVSVLVTAEGSTAPAGSGSGAIVT